MLAANHQPMGIALLGMNGKDRPMMEFFLQRHWSSNCIVVPEHKANLCILDLDGIDGRKLLQQQQDQYNERPLIVLSVHDKQIEGVKLLRKPLRLDSLKGAIEIYRSELLQHTEAAETTAPVVIQKPVRRKRRAAPAPIINEISETNERRKALPDATSQARIIRRACSTNDLDESTLANGTYYQHTANFQDILKRAVEQCKREGRPFRLIFQDGKSVTLLPDSNLSITDLSDTNLRPRCLLSLDSSQIIVEPSLNSEAYLLRSSNNVLPLSIDALLWKVTLWSSRGRLPMGTSTKVAVGLRQWPNLTRLLAIPEFIRIAALWTKSPISISRTVDTLNIKYGFVYAFFSACYALDLIQVHEAGLDQSVSEIKVPKKDSNPGLLRRILRRLRVA